MKKIVGIIAAVAMAASVFAVDISANLKWARNSLFDMAFADGAKPSVLSLAQPQGYVAHGAFGLKVSVSGEKAGASFELAPNYGKGAGYVELAKMQTWLQPIDQLKIILGDNDFGYGGETIDYSKINGIAGDGFGIVIMPIDGLKINLYALPGLFNPFGTPSAWILNGTIGKGGASVGYSADFGTINVSYLYDGTSTSSIGVGYDGKIDPVTLGVHGKLDITDKLSGITADLFVATGFDAFGIKAYAKFSTDLDKTNTLNIKFLGTYGLDAGTIYLKVNNTSNGADGDATANLLAEPFYLVIQPGFQWNIGAAACDVGVALVINGSTVMVRVPFSVNIGF